MGFVLDFMIIFLLAVILYGFYPHFTYSVNYLNEIMYEFVSVLLAFFKLLVKLFYAFKCVLCGVPTSFYYFELSILSLKLFPFTWFI